MLCSESGRSQRVLAQALKQSVATVCSGYSLRVLAQALKQSVATAAVFLWAQLLGVSRKVNVEVAARGVTVSGPMGSCFEIMETDRTRLRGRSSGLGGLRTTC